MEIRRDLHGFSFVRSKMLIASEIIKIRNKKWSTLRICMVQNMHQVK